MRIKSLLLLVFCIIITKTYASDQYALIIGIDKYEAPAKEEILAKDRSGWSNLDGCVNDALSMKEIIEVKYNFNKKNIIFLIHLISLENGDIYFSVFINIEELGL